jgi:hypothetical protein
MELIDPVSKGDGMADSTNPTVATHENDFFCYNQD